MAEENYTIGEMKAIGFPGKAIEKLYQMKYIILVLAAGVLGFLAAIPFGDFFSSSVIMYCGYGTGEWMKWVFPFIGVILLSLVVMPACRRIIRKNLKSTVVELMRGEEKIKKEGNYSLPSTGLKDRNLTIAFGELKCKWKEYSVIFFVFVFSSFLILLPMNLKNTVENPSFMTYMGVGECDIRIDIQYSGKLTEQKDTARSYLENDSETKKYAIYRNGYVQSQNVDGDITYGGKTAKAAINFDENDVEVYIIYLDVCDGVPIQEKTDELRSILTDSKITPISEFVSQTLGGITDNMSLVEGAAIVISLLLIMLISVMFLQLITAREHSAIAIKKAIGFSNRDLRIQFGIRILVIQSVAIIVGTVLANFRTSGVYFAPLFINMMEPFPSFL